MDNLAAARSQMGISLAFHIIFAVIGVALPLMMTIAEWRFRATGDAAYLLLAKRWARGTTILFAVGAVSGTVLSFELGLLWPQFMQYAGAVIGMPFSTSQNLHFALMTKPFVPARTIRTSRIAARDHVSILVLPRLPPSSLRVCPDRPETLSGARR